MKRLNFLDYLRGVAIILMFITHSFRLQTAPALNGGWTEGLSIFLEFFMFIEPLTPALFLFIAGYSLQLSFSRDSSNRGWAFWPKYHKIVLWSYAIALVAEGFYPERFLFSSGILQSIATGLFAASFLLGKKHEAKFLTLLILLFAAGGFILNHLNIQQAPFNAGLGVWFPQMGFIFAGSLYFIKKDNLPKGLKDLVLIGVIILYTSNVPWVNVITTTSSGWTVKDWAYHAREFQNWNHTGWGFLANLGLVFLLVDTIAKVSFKLPLQGFINQLGSKALTLYVYHLAVISVFYAMGWKFNSPQETLVFILLLLLGAFGISKTKLLV